MVKGKQREFKRIYTIINSAKINNTPKTMKVNICKVSEYTPPRITPKFKFRAGVIPYTIDNGNVYFAFGLDTKFNELTDFGGGVKQNDDSVISGGIREFIEESLTVFEPVCKEDLGNNYVLYNNKMLIILIFYSVKPATMRKMFDEKKQKLVARDPSKTFEVGEIIWVSKDDLIQSLAGRGLAMYSRVKNMFNYIPKSLDSFIVDLVRTKPDKSVTNHP